MESNLLINHPASLDTVTALKRRQWCIASVHLRITVYDCDSTEALNTLYLEPWSDVHLCISHFISAMRRKLKSNYSPACIRFHPNSHSFPTSCVLQPHRFLALDVLLKIWHYSYLGIRYHPKAYQKEKGGLDKEVWDNQVKMDFRLISFNDIYIYII